MDRRSSDRVRQRLGELERLRAELAGDALPGVGGELDAEIERLRHEQHRSDLPFIGGRRASDPKPS